MVHWCIGDFQEAGRIGAELRNGILSFNKRTHFYRLFFLSLFTLDHAIQASPSYTLASISFIFNYLIGLNGIPLYSNRY